jgi:hypothetical protein
LSSPGMKVLSNPVRFQDFIIISYNFFFKIIENIKIS